MRGHAAGFSSYGLLLNGTNVMRQSGCGARVTEDGANVAGSNEGEAKSNKPLRLAV